VEPTNVVVNVSHLPTRLINEFGTDLSANRGHAHMSTAKARALDTIPYRERH